MATLHFAPFFCPIIIHKHFLIQKFLETYAEVNLMQSQIESFLDQWLPALEKDHRNYITVAIGCTGGQHRSVYLVEKLSQRFGAHWLTLKRHRELDSK